MLGLGVAVKVKGATVRRLGSLRVEGSLELFLRSHRLI